MAPAQENATYLDRARGDSIWVLLAEHDVALRQFFAALLRNADDVSIVVEGEDGASTGGRGLHTHPRAPVFANHMPRLSGIYAAHELRQLQLALCSNPVMRA
jgi:DNA-binding NarL/FixJ family response regulator